MSAVLLLVVGLLSAQTVAAPSGPATDGAETPTATDARPDPPRATDGSASGTTAPAADRLVPVRPSHQDGAADQDRPSRQDRAAELLRDVLNRPADGALEGTEVTLYQVLADPTGRPRRAALIRAYWQLSAAVADYHDALAAQRRLEQLADVAAAPADEIAADQFKLALATAEVRVAATRLAAVRGQHQLGQLRPDLAMTSLPLPADRPHTGGYRTLYDQIFAGQIVPAARRLNDTLSLAHDLIAAQAAAVDAADRLLTSATDRLKASGGTAAEALDYDRQLVAERRALVTSVRDYNLAIAEYAQLVAPEGSDPARLVAMLIKTHGGPVRQRPTTAGGMPTAASGVPTAAGDATAAAEPATPGRLPVEDDGMVSVLKRRPAAGVTPAGGELPAGDRSGSGVVQATAEEPIDQRRTAPEATSPPAKDSFVPRRLP